MDNFELRDVAFDKLNKGYETQWELMDDLFAWLDLHLYIFYKNHQWLGPKNDMRNMLGLVISREEFEHNLAKSSQRGLTAMMDGEDFSLLETAGSAISHRLGRTSGELPLLLMFDRCDLDSFEQGCVIFAYAAALDRKYEKLLGYLQDDIMQKAPGTALAVQLFLPSGSTVEEYLSRFMRTDKFTELFERDKLSSGSLVLCQTALEFLSGGAIGEQPGIHLFDPEAALPEELAVGNETARYLDEVFKSGQKNVICINGASGSGKRFQVEQLMTRQGGRIVFADMDSEQPLETARAAALGARLTKASLCCYHLDARNAEKELIPPSEKLINGLLELGLGDDGRLFLLSQSPIRRGLRGGSFELEIADLTEDERILLFEKFLSGYELEKGLSAPELASKFRFVPRQIKLACEQAKNLAELDGAEYISGKLMHSCCYKQVVHRLEDLAKPVKACFTWDDVVMPGEQKRILKHACSHVKFRHKVYGEWGFEQKIAYGRGLSILFAGAPGTGKTMSAQIIAAELNMEMYKINISQIVSKYIGETEKNLQAVFNEAKNSNCILFFDECDAIFGKRSEVKDAHDRNANVEVAYLLQQIEEHDGVCIMATNLLGNIDAAFMRRITYVVHFPFPDAKMREEIYRRTIPEDTPLSDDIDWTFLAEKFELSGGHIKNIVVSAAFLAALEDSTVGMSQLLRAAVGEMRKNEIVVVREELREYADLLGDSQ